MTSFFSHDQSDLDKISQTGAEWYVDCGDMVEIETESRIPIWRTLGRVQWHVISIYVPHSRVLPPGEFNDMSSQSHVSHCRVLPHSEFNVMIPEPRATLQGDRIPSATLKIIFHFILFFVFLMQFGLRRAAAFVSYSIRLFFFTHLVIFMKLVCTLVLCFCW